MSQTAALLVVGRVAAVILPDGFFDILLVTRPCIMGRLCVCVCVYAALFYAIIFTCMLQSDFGWANTLLDKSGMYVKRMQQNWTRIAVHCAGTRRSYREVFRSHFGSKSDNEDMRAALAGDYSLMLSMLAKTITSFYLHVGVMAMLAGANLMPKDVLAAALAEDCSLKLSMLANSDHRFSSITCMGALFASGAHEQSPGHSQIR